MTLTYSSGGDLRFSVEYSGSSSSETISFPAAETEWTTLALVYNYTASQVSVSFSSSNLTADSPTTISAGWSTLDTAYLMQGSDGASGCGSQVDWVVIAPYPMAALTLNLTS